MKASDPHNRLRAMVASLLFALIALALISLPVRAQTAPCIGMADALGQLSDKYREVVLFQGAGRDGQVLVITANPDGSSWTAIVQSGPKGCILGGGKRWQIGAAATDAVPGQEG